MSLKALGLAAVAAGTLVTSTMVMTDAAEARPRGWGHGGFHGGWGGRGFHRGGWGYRGGYGYRRGGYGWGAAGAGLAAGLALGALAARPAYGYGYYGGYAPAYYGGGYAPAYYGGGCVWKPRRVWGPYGWQYARVRVCY